MASPGASSLPSTRSTRRRTPAAVSNSGVLPPDLLFDVLLRIQAKELCRLRAVCRSWRSLSSDRLFIKAHAARHRSPLLLAKFRDDDAHVHVVDLSGDTFKRIAGASGDHQLLCTRLDLACLGTRSNSCRVLNPATGAVCALPKYPALGDPSRPELYKPGTFYAFGQVPSTGEYKVLRMFNRSENRSFGGEQLFDVFTINSGASNARWRVLSRDYFVEAESAVVVDGAVYFLMNGRHYPNAISSGIPPDYIASLDIRTEQWRRDLQGPISGNLDMEHADDRKEYRHLWHQLSLGELEGSLVLANHRSCQFILDIWFLTDFHSGLWVKKYSIKTESIVQSLSDDYRVKPLLVLDDGRLLIFLPLTGQLLICDPEANTYTSLEMRQLDSIAVYAGSLLSLQTGWHAVELMSVPPIRNHHRAL
ncbi:hypothetical protein HU200_015654 [Digitaria exilis]|uniref:F-box domain-containing protein n=1 Tax=Digitaria exilis TaxID=1010633 RepID=A0A835F8L9_9POAL|nr:hypothetical protein HU200_015654 [Digitaria exilis]